MATSYKPMPFRILSRSLIPAVVWAAVALSTTSVNARSTGEKEKMSDVAATVARMLENAHYSRQPLNREVEPGVTQARRALDRYFALLDYNKLFFTQKDINEFTAKYGSAIQDDILLGNLDPAYEIYDRFLDRVVDRVEKIKTLLEKDFTFDSNRAAQISRDKAPWPTDEADADRIWQSRIEAELLQAVIADHAQQEAAAKKQKPADDTKAAATTNAPPTPTLALPKRTPKETVLKRYERLAKAFQEDTREDQADTFLSALTQSYDPHSEYMSQRALDNFNIQMGLSLVGIGAELRSDDGYAKIQRLIPGGPAERGGQLRANDRITAVAQGDGEFEDVMDMKLDKVVEKIRGKKGTTVRLQVLPADSPDPTKVDVIRIVRDEVKLKDEEAKAQVIEAKGPGDKTTKLGWITLPSFYANMDRGQPPRSTTKDVAALLKRLKREGIEGLVVDLRRDAGGSLDEAVKLTGLFIPQGPVVQAKDTDGSIRALNDPDSGSLWDGPMVVLINRLSASASEIFAAALQDYGRAVIVGDTQSFGKGTVQTLVDVDRFMPSFAATGKSGAVKLTIQKFYRIKGGSTQLHGVDSDIVLPSLTDQVEFGEGSLKYPLDYDEVPAQNFKATGNLTTDLPRLRTLSETRVAANREFQYIREDMARLRKQRDENSITLNETKRQSEIQADKSRREARNEERKKRGNHEFNAVEVTLDTVNAPYLQRVALDKPPKRSSFEEMENESDPAKPEGEEIYADPIRDEALHIVLDMIHPGGHPAVTAKADAAP